MIIITLMVATIRNRNATRNTDTIVDMMTVTCIIIHDTLTAAATTSKRTRTLT